MSKKILTGLITIFLFLIFVNHINAEKENLTIEEIKEPSINTAKLDDMIQELALIDKTQEPARYNDIENEILSFKKLISNLNYKKEKVQKYNIEFNSLGLSVEESKKLLNQAVIELQLGNFETANMNLDKSLNSLGGEYNATMSAITKTLENKNSALIENEIEVDRIILFKNEISKNKNTINVDMLKIFLVKINNINSSVEKLINIKKIKNYIQSKNYPVKKISDLQSESIIAFKLGNDGKVETLGNDAKLILNKLEEANNSISSFEKRIQSYPSINLTEETNLLAKAKMQYNNEDFEKAIYSIHIADESIDNKESNIILSSIINKNTPSNFLLVIREKWQFLLIIGLSLLIIAIIFNNKLKPILIKKRVRLFIKEKIVLKNLLIKAQRNYFIKKTIGKNSYENLLDKYQKKMIEADEKISTINKKLHNKKKK